MTEIYVGYSEDNIAPQTYIWFSSGDILSRTIKYPAKNVHGARISQHKSWGREGVISQQRARPFLSLFRLMDKKKEVGVTLSPIFLLSDPTTNISVCLQGITKRLFPGFVNVK